MKLLVAFNIHLMPKFKRENLDFWQKSLGEPIGVINGDLWDFESFVKSPWKKLFPLLKRKVAVYITGNHDREYLIDKKLEWLQFFSFSFDFCVLSFLYDKNL